MKNLCMAADGKGIVFSPGLVNDKLRLLTDQEAGKPGCVDLDKEQARVLAGYLLEFVGEE